MTTIKATADPATGSVLLDITKTGTVLKVLRNDANGIAEVRALAGQFPSAGRGKVIVSDYEAAAGLNTYTAVCAGSGAGTSVVLDITDPWLMVPVMPHYARQVESVTGYSAERESLGSVKEVSRRPDPLVNLAPLGLRRGKLELWAGTMAQARDIESVFNRGEVAMLKQRVPGLDMYFFGTSTAIEPQEAHGETNTRYRLTVSYTELARPLGPLAGALGWTFDALAAAWPTFDALAASYASFDDVTINKVAR